MSKNSEFTEDVLPLLKQASNQQYRFADDGAWGAGDTSSVISGALQGIGMFTFTRQSVAKTKANASMHNTTYTVDSKKSNSLVTAATVVIGIILSGLMAVVVIKSTK